MEEITLNPKPSTSQTFGHKRGTKPGTKIVRPPRKYKYRPEVIDYTDPAKKVSVKIERISDGQGDVVEVKLNYSDERLVQIAYPGDVINPENAIRTLGGIVRISDAIQTSGKKVELRYRPGSISCYPAVSPGRPTVGLLLRIRRKKKPASSVSETAEISAEDGKIDLDELETNSQLLAETRNALIGDKQRILDEENAIPEVVAVEPDDAELPEPEEEGSKDMVRKKIPDKKTIIRLPQAGYSPKQSDLIVEPVGLINQTFDSFGLCDFQFLPTELEEDGTHHSVEDRIYPGFGDPDNAILYDYESGEAGEKTYVPFLTPPTMSKVDRPIDNVNKTYVTSELSENENGMTIVTAGTVESIRGKRSVYTHMVNFPDTDDPEANTKFVVPKSPLEDAMKEAKRKFCKISELEKLKRIFEERPMWTKLALQRQTKLPFKKLKYLLPCVSYFCSNGPWRGLWTRLGYDPRNIVTSFQYQLLDYRVPAIYKRFIEETEGQDPECLSQFKLNSLPPKSQMFYQLCDIKIPDIDELMGSLTVRLNSENPPYSFKYGFLNEETLEYCRFCIGRCIEVHLHMQGKISEVNLPVLQLDPGGLIPTSKLYDTPRKSKGKARRIGKKRDHRGEVDEKSQDAPSTSFFTLNDYFEDDDDMGEEEEEEDDEDDEEAEDPVDFTTQPRFYPEEFDDEDSDDSLSDTGDIQFEKELTQDEF